MDTQSKKIRLGLAGLGFGQAVHLPVWQGIPGVVLVGLADLDLNKAQAAGLQYGVNDIYDDYQKLLRNDLDAVSLALPPQQNEAACLMALKKGISVFCEKPLAVSLAAAEALSLLAKNRIAMIDFEFMEAAAFQKLKELLGKKELGPIQHLNIAWLTNSVAQRQQLWGWKTDALRGGGVVALLGSHLFYILEQLFGRVIKLSADLNNRSTWAFAPTGSQVADDLAHLILELEGGIKVSMVLSNASTGSSVQRWEIIGASGTLCLANDTLDPLNGFSLKIGRGEAQWISLHQDQPSGNQDSRQAAFRILAERFIQAVIQKHPARPDFKDGLRVQEIMSAVYRSSREHWPISL